MGYWSVALEEVEFGRTVSCPPLDNHHVEPGFVDIVDEPVVGHEPGVDLASPL